MDEIMEIQEGEQKSMILEEDFDPNHEPTQKGRSFFFS